MVTRYLGLHNAAGDPLLVLDDGRPHDQLAKAPFWVNDVDFGTRAPRDNTSPASYGDGDDDRTRHYGPSTVTVELDIRGDAAGSPYAYFGRLSGLMYPERRLYLHAQIDDWDEPRRILVRGEAAPRNFTTRKPTVQFQWKAPQGWLESVAVKEAKLRPDGLVRGLSSPIHFPVHFPPANPSSSQGFVVGGEIPTDAVFDFYGLAAAPAVTDSTGRAIAFRPTFTVPAGRFTRAQRNGPGGIPLVASNGDVTQQQFGELDFTRTTPGLAIMLEPGSNRLKFTAAATSSDAFVRVSWRDRY